MESKGDSGGWINRNSVSYEGNLVVRIHYSWTESILFKVFLFLRMFSECFMRASFSVLFHKPSEVFRGTRDLAKHMKP